MSVINKILVVFDAKKYGISVESDFKLLTFRQVLSEIKRQINENISQQTHWFEVYDNDFEEYVLITKDDQLVENLARVRVKEKDKNEIIDSSPKKTNTELDSFIDKLFAAKKSNTFAIKNINFDDNQSITCSAVEANNLNNNSESLKTLMEEKCKTFEDLVNKNPTKGSEDLKSASMTDTQSVVSCGRVSVATPSEAVPKEQPINYLEIETSHDYRLSPTCPHLYYYTVVERFHRQSLVCMRYKIGDYKGVQKLLDLMFVNRSCFAQNPSNDPSNLKWKVVSDQMVANGFTDWTPKKCRQGFACAVDLYKKTMTSCPDFETAYKVNPLFSDFHSFDIKFLVCLREYNQIKDMRLEFDRKPISSVNTTKVFVNKSLKKWNSTTLTPTPTAVNAYQMKDHLVKMNRVRDKMTPKVVDEIKALIQSVQTVVKHFGPFSVVHHFWQSVSTQMRAEGYAMSRERCHELFIAHVCDYYSLAMIYSTDEKSAQELYPLFQCIHSIDLSQCLNAYSFNKINEVRQKFVDKVSKA